VVALGALMLLWPAIYNGFPLLYPDSMTYLADGTPVARALFQHHFSSYYGVRSLLYSLVLLPFHWNRTAWPVAALQALLAAWVLWLTVRALTPRRASGNYLGLMVALSLLSSLSWYSVFIMPDVLGPLVYLAFFLVVFARNKLARWEILSLCAIACWGITAHATHLLLAAGLCGLLVLLSLFQKKHWRQRLQGVALTVAIVALAIAVQMALNAYLTGVPTLNIERPPYLLARIIADGPGRLYLDQHCDRQQWAVCAYRAKLDDDPDDFLWAPDGVYQSATEQNQTLIRNQEMPLVKAAVSAYPRLQLQHSAANFHDQLLAYGLYGFDPSPWILDAFPSTMPAAQASYQRSLQARGALPLEFLDSILNGSVKVSLVMIVLLLALRVRRLSAQLWALTVMVFTMIAANALLTGVLSVVDDRYGCRVIWMIPLLAGLLLVDLLEHRAARRESVAQHRESSNLVVQ